MTTTLTELQERLDECNEHRQNYQSDHWPQYEAEAQYIEEIMEDWDEEWDEYDELNWYDSMEGIIQDHIELIYEDWFQSEKNIYCDKEGNWPANTSGYQWMAWALDSTLIGFHDRMVEYANENDKELPEWYKKDYDW